MVATSRNSTRQRSYRKRVRYFYLNQDLHRVLRIVRPEDFVEAWCYREERVVGYVWSDVRKNMQRAFTLQQVSAMIGRHRVQLQTYILNGDIKSPQRIYTLDGDKKPGKYFMSESDVLALHDYLLTVHVGRPRNDGKITPGKMPTKAELRAMMKHDVVTGVMRPGGEFVPTWKEVDW